MPVQYFPVDGRFVATDDGGYVLIDTNDDMLCVKPSDVEVGSVSVPARTASSQGPDGDQVVVDTEADYYIATLDIPGAKVVRGMMRVTWASNPEPADNLWRQASGTHLDILDGVSITTVPQNDLAGYNRVATMGGYTFYVNELGHLVMRERLVIRSRDAGSPPTRFNRARQAANVSFRLLVGFFLRSDFTRRASMQFRGKKGAFQPAAAHTIQDVPAGYGFPGRRVAVTIHGVVNGGTGRAPSSVKLNGVTATIHAAVGNNAGNDSSVCIASAVVPSGTTIDVALVWPVAQTVVSVSLYALANVSGNPVVQTVDGIGASLNRTVSLDDNDIGLAANTSRSGQSSASQATWLNAARQTSDWMLNYGFETSAIINANTSGTVRVTWPGSGEQSLAIAIWSGA